MATTHLEAVADKGEARAYRASRDIVRVKKAVEGSGCRVVVVEVEHEAGA